jgi:hypothetical protein
MTRQAGSRLHYCQPSRIGCGIEKGFGQPLRLGGRIFRPSDGELASCRRAHKRNLVFLGKGEVDKIRGVVNVEVKLLRFDVGLEARRNAASAPSVSDRNRGNNRPARSTTPFFVRLCEGKEAYSLRDVTLIYKRREFLAGKGAVVLRFQALRGEQREHVIEVPVVANAGNRTVGGIDKLAHHGHPDMRVSDRRSSPQTDGIQRSGWLEMV